jgi:hypothetical protein
VHTEAPQVVFLRATDPSTWPIEEASGRADILTEAVDSVIGALHEGRTLNHPDRHDRPRG